MASLFRPRYLILVTLLLCGVFFYLYTSRQLLNAARTSYHSLRDPGLSTRLAKAEEIYQRTLKGREQLLNKFGPSPKDIVMYVLFFFSLLVLEVGFHVPVVPGFHQTRTHGPPM